MKKKYLFLSVACILVGFSFCSLCFHSLKVIKANADVIETQQNPLPVIVIDAGHGGFDGGAVGVDGIVEKDINLAIAQKLHLFFQINGIESILTRESDDSLEDEGLQTIRKRKNSDIHNRMALADSFEDSILLSIHQNKFPQSKYFGAQVFYGPKNEDSSQLGQIMQKKLVEMLQPENTRQAKACGDSVYLIYHAKMPALLIECGFLSNPDDAAKLSSPEYQGKVAFTIFSAVSESLGLCPNSEEGLYNDGTDG